MCGICGFTGNKDINLLKNMCDIIKHRGPDEEGLYFNKNIHLGIRRLSIIDLQTGSQPIYNEKKNIVVVYNGEIYNYREIKNELVKKKHKFYTNTDTEILVHLYEEEGMRFLEKLNGIFSFALYDIDRDKLILARDQFGVKPLFYSFINNNLIFGSEIKSLLLYPAIKKNINFNALHYFLNYRFICGEKTLFDNIYNLLPGHYLIYHNNKIDIKKYYDLKLKEEKIDLNDAIYQFKNLFKKAVKQQLVADVDVGAYLSGGLDSSIIVKEAFEQYSNKLKTFTLGFNEPTDEFNDAKIIAEKYNTDHYDLLANVNLVDNLPKTIWHCEIPKINAIQVDMVSKFASSKVKVILSGQGGDELLAGQVNYFFVQLFPFLHNALDNSFVQDKVLSLLSDFVFSIQQRGNLMKFDEIRRGIQTLLSYGNKTKYYAILRNVWDFDEKFYKNVYSKEFVGHFLKYKASDFLEKYFKRKDISFLQQVLYCELKEKMVADSLLVEDRMSMANSLESRVPFLDRNLVEFCFQIPSNLKMNKFRSKYLLKKAYLKDLPKKIITKSKQGFGFHPYYHWECSLKKIAKIILNNNKEKINFINIEYVNKIIDLPPSKSLRWHYFFIWNLIGYVIWQKMFIYNFNSTPDMEIESYF